MNRIDRLTQWLKDLRWAANAMRARRWRRGLIYSQRQHFDHALRPRISADAVVSYPDAFYNITIDDLCRAMIHSTIASTHTSPKSAP